LVPYVAKHPDGVAVDDLAVMVGVDRELLLKDLDLLTQVGPPDGDPGEYLLTVRALGESTKDPRGGPPTPGKLLTPKKYTSSKTSGLQVTIQPGSNDVKLELRSDPSEKKKRKR
jgi:hypothetical protein